MERRERALAVAVASVAALRVALFAAAFPFFSNVDEHRHVDAVLKYARGYLPAPGTDAYEPGMADLLGIYGSPEYHARAHDEDGEPRSIPPPPWRGSPARMVKMIEYNEAYLSRRPNLEAFQPPVYYAAAGLWLRVGRGLGLEGARLLYWVRALSAVATFALVLATWAFLRRVYGDPFLVWGVPVLLAVFPQDALYYVTRDALSPLVGAAALFGAVAVARRPERGAGGYAATGLAAAVAVLTKYTGAVTLGLCALASGVAWWERRPRAPRVGRKLLLLWTFAAVPVALWLARNQLLFGEWLATSGKVERLGWGRKGFSELWGHPLFSPSGLWIFVSELIPTFWRGELAWYRRTLALPWADAFYVGSSLLFTALAALGFARGRERDARIADGLCLAALAGAVGILAFLSLLFVFGEKTNPTADNPYLSQGRLVAFALVPFAIVYGRGIQTAVGWLRGRARSAAAWALLIVVVGVVCASEAMLGAPVFASGYNWFHLP